MKRLGLTSAITLVTIGALLSAACGDDESSSGGSTAGATGGTAGTTPTGGTAGTTPSGGTGGTTPSGGTGGAAPTGGTAGSTPSGGSGGDSGAAGGGAGGEPVGGAGGMAGQLLAGGGGMAGQPMAGAAGVAGQPMAGGAAGAAGQPVAGAAGQPAAGAGGMPAGGAGGTTGSAGAAGGAGDSLGPFNFDTDLEGWGFTGTPTVPTSSVAWYTGVDCPSAGCAQVTLGFTATTERAAFGLSFTSTPLDLSGQTLRVRIQRISGTGSGGIQVFAMSTGYNFADGGWNNFSLADGAFAEFEFPLAPSGSFVPTEVIRVGVQFNTGSTASPAGESVFLVDWYVVEP